MSSQIELYPHNQIAYDKLCDMLAHSDRACVIQPTGTGKFVIIAKLVQDNSDKRFLLLGTNDYMSIPHICLGDVHGEGRADFVEVRLHHPR